MAESIKSTDQKGFPVAGLEGKYLTFSLGTEEYGISILGVKEIIGMLPIRQIPQTPEFIKGVINLRGKVIPILDLRLKFGLEELEATERTCIIVVEIGGKEASVLTGIVVDSVSEVLNIRGSDIAETPDLGVRLNTDYIRGMAKTDKSVRVLLNIDRVVQDHAWSP
jgi:purine-binding chemotaxis protein CheW